MVINLQEFCCCWINCRAWSYFRMHDTHYRTHFKTSSKTCCTDMSSKLAEAQGAGERAPWLSTWAIPCTNLCNIAISGEQRQGCLHGKPHSRLTHQGVGHGPAAAGQAVGDFVCQPPRDSSWPRVRDAHRRCHRVYHRLMIYGASRHHSLQCVRFQAALGAYRQVSFYCSVHMGSASHVHYDSTIDRETSSATTNAKHADSAQVDRAALQSGRRCKA